MGGTEDLTGKVFGCLTVIKLVGRDANRNGVWECRCSCGTILNVKGQSIKYKQRSCGPCSKIRAGLARRTHGESGQNYLYRLWRAMKFRCGKVSGKYYLMYGERGISVYSPWADSYPEFAAWIRGNLGERPSNSHSLDRVNNSGNYEPGNLRWASVKEQNNNTRKNALITYRGQTKTIPEWAELTGICQRTLHTRRHLGWSDTKILSTPVKGKRSRVDTVEMSHADILRTDLRKP